MKYVYGTVAGLSLVALACAPAMAADQKSKTSDTQQIPKSDSSVTVDPKTDVSPSASPSTTPPAPGATESTVNPSAPAGAASPQTDAGESKDKPKY